MTPSTISLSQAKARLSALVNEVAYGHKHFLILSHGKAKAKLVPLTDHVDNLGGDDFARGLSKAKKHLMKLRRLGKRFNSVADLQDLRSGKDR